MWCPFDENSVTNLVREQITTEFNAFIQKVEIESGRNPTREELKQFTEARAQYYQNQALDIVPRYSQSYNQQHGTESEIEGNCTNRENSEPSPPFTGNTGNS